MDLKNIFNVNGIYAKNGEVQKKHLGKFYHDGKTFAVLEDHSGMMHDLPDEGPSTQKIRKILDRLKLASHIQIKSKHDEALEDLKNLPAAAPKTPIGSLQPKVKKPPIFDYIRQGMDRPHTIELSQGRALLDGNLLESHETNKVLENVKSGLAVLRHKDLSKHEGNLLNLMKSEDSSGLVAALDHMRSQVSVGNIPHEYYDRIRRELFQDDLTKLGNKRAFTEHKDRGARNGVYLSLDGNSTKSINDALGHSAGDSAIMGMGEALRNAIDKTVGPDVAKSWRVGGDEFAVHVPAYEHAAKILRQLRTELEAATPIGGSHRLSMSVGVGGDYAQADHALQQAKAQKISAIASHGGDPDDRTSQAPHALYVHSLLLGHEGMIPNIEQSPLVQPSMISQAPKLQLSSSPGSEPPDVETSLPITK